MVGIDPLNQLFNNPGLRGDNGIQLLLPFWGGETDLWLRFRHNQSSADQAETSSYSLMIYLDLQSLGPTAGRLLAAGNDLLGLIMVANEFSAMGLRKLLPAHRERLRSSFSGSVEFKVEVCGPSRIADFQRRTFLAGLSPSFTSAG